MKRESAASFLKRRAMAACSLGHPTVDMFAPLRPGHTAFFEGGSEDGLRAWSTRCAANHVAAGGSVRWIALNTLFDEDAILVNLEDALQHRCSSSAEALLPAADRIFACILDPAADSPSRFRDVIQNACQAASGSSELPTLIVLHGVGELFPGTPRCESVWLDVLCQQVRASATCVAIVTRLTSSKPSSSASDGPFKLRICDVAARHDSTVPALLRHSTCPDCSSGAPHTHASELVLCSQPSGPGPWRHVLAFVVLPRGAHPVAHWPQS